LTWKEIDSIYNLDLSDNPKLEKVRDLFVVACYTGVRYSDLSKLTASKISAGLIEIVPTKTRGTSPEPISIPLVGITPKIFEKYLTLTGKVLPRVLSNQKMNDYVKMIGEKAKLNELVKNPHYKGGIIKDEKEFVPRYTLLSMHTSRRSFATNFYLDGFPVLDIMRITGHKTIKSFMRYIRMSNKDAAVRIQEKWNQKADSNTELISSI
jgi:integrase